MTSFENIKISNYVMKAVKTLQRYKCDFCKKKSVRHVIELHEKRCFRNLNRYCDYCDNKGYTEETIAEGFSAIKQGCPYCEAFDGKILKEIEEREKKDKLKLISK